MYAEGGIGGARSYGAIKSERVNPAEIVSYKNNLFKFIAESMVDLDEAERILIVLRVFEYATEDGLILANRLNLSPHEISDVLTTPSFVDKHRPLMAEARRLVTRFYMYIDQSNRPYADKIINLGGNIEDDRESIGDDRKKKRKVQLSEKASELVDKVDSFYLTYIKNKTFEGVSNPETTKFEQAYDSFVKQHVFASRELFYAGTCRQIIGKKLGVGPEDDKALKKELAKRKIKEDFVSKFFGSQFVTKEDVDAVAKVINVDPENFRKARMSPLASVYVIAQNEAKKEARKAIQNSLDIRYGKGNAVVIEYGDGDMRVEKDVHVNKSSEIEQAIFEKDAKDFEGKYYRQKLDKALSEKKLLEAFSLLKKGEITERIEEICDLCLADNRFHTNWQQEEFFWIAQQRQDVGTKLFDSLINNPGHTDYIGFVTLAIGLEDEARFINAFEKMSQDTSFVSDGITSSFIKFSERTSKSDSFKQKIIEYVFKYPEKINFSAEMLKELSLSDSSFFERYYQQIFARENAARRGLSIDISKVSEVCKELGKKDVYKRMYEDLKGNAVNFSYYLSHGPIEFFELYPGDAKEGIEICSATLKNDSLLSILRKIAKYPQIYQDEMASILKHVEEGGSQYEKIKAYAFVGNDGAVITELHNQFEEVKKLDSTLGKIVGASVFTGNSADETVATLNEINKLKNLLSRDVVPVLTLSSPELAREIARFFAQHDGMNTATAIAISLNDTNFINELLEEGVFLDRDYLSDYMPTYEMKLALKAGNYKKFENVLLSVLQNERQNAMDYVTRYIFDDCKGEPEKIALVLNILYEQGKYDYIKSMVEYYASKEDLAFAGDIYKKLYKQLIETGVPEETGEGLYFSLSPFAGPVIWFAYRIGDIEMLHKLFYFFQKEDRPQHANKCLELLKRLNGDVVENSSKLQLTLAEQKYIEMYKDISNPKSIDVDAWIREKENNRNPTHASSTVARVFNKLFSTDPELFAGNMVAKADDTDARKISQLLIQIFPEIFDNKAKERSENSPKGFSGILNGIFGEAYDPSGYERSKRPSAAAYLRPRSAEALWGGDPKISEKDLANFKVMTTDKPVTCFQMTDMYFGSTKREEKWQKLPVPINRRSLGSGDTVEVTITELEYTGGGQIILPNPNESNVQPQSIICTDNNGNKVVGQIERNINGITSVDLGSQKDGKGSINTVVYQYELAPSEIDTEIPQEDFDRHVDHLKKILGGQQEKLLEENVRLPEDVYVFLESIRELTPYEKAIEIENYAREVTYYDFDNGEVKEQKFGRTPNELLTIMQFRMEDIRKKKPELAEQLSNKLFAGVCTDFANLTASMCRAAGVPAGVAVGFMQDGDKVTLERAHAVCVVPWPTTNGDIDTVMLDGTPEGVTDDEKARMGFRLESLSTRRASREDGAEMRGRAEKRIAELTALLDSGDMDAIEKLDIREIKELLDVVFSKKLKGSNVDMIESVLSAARYAGMSKLVQSEELKDKVEFTRFIDGEVKTFKANKTISKNTEARGERLMRIFEEYAHAYSRDIEVFSQAEAYDLLLNIFGMVGKSLTPLENKVTKLAIAYLKAKDQRDSRRVT